MLERYNIALDGRRAKIDLLYVLSQEYMDMKCSVFSCITCAAHTAKELEKISLGKSVLNSVDYIKRLVESERRSNRPNKEDR